MLGVHGAQILKAKMTRRGAEIDLSAIPWTLLPSFEAWVLKFEYLKTEEVRSEFQNRMFHKKRIEMQKRTTYRHISNRMIVSIRTTVSNRTIPQGKISRFPLDGFSCSMRFQIELDEPNPMKPFQFHQKISEGSCEFSKFSKF